MIDWPLAFSSASKAYDAIKLLRGLEKNFDEAAFKAKIADITADMADLKNALTDVRADAAEKDAEIARLREAFAFRQDQTVMARRRPL